MASVEQAREERGPQVRLGRAWRRLGTGFCFVAYGGLGWLAGLTVLPILLLLPGPREVRQQRIASLMSWSYRRLLGMIALLRVGYVTVEGRERLARADGRLLVANHPMYLDALVLLGLLPEARCVVKQAMWRNPFFRRFVRAVGYVGNADSVGLLHDCVAVLHAGEPLVLFPEGTRSTPGAPLRFPRGAAQVAVRAGCEIIPVVIRCEPLALGKGQRWHHVADRPWQLQLRICEPQRLADLGWREDMSPGVAARHVTSGLEAFFRDQLADREAGTARIAATSSEAA